MNVTAYKKKSHGKEQKNIWIFFFKCESELKLMKRKYIITKNT